MKNFKERWEINSNWQLIFPFIGIIGILYSAFKIINLFSINSTVIKVVSVLILSYLLLKITLFLFKKLEKKWKLDYKWEMIRVFIVFAITGSSSVFVGRPILKLIGITKDNLSPAIYWTLYILIGFIIYQILLVLIGWLLGQHHFFWNFEKKMLKRMKLGFLINEK